MWTSLFINMKVYLSAQRDAVTTVTGDVPL